ncbi:MAG: Alw26I/Eco31I/Esp3I family type II restriction endonuclease [Candidatus Bathyarchaeia archaeon]|jgi:Alw26I/Eco31I/Esp3I family type II restriction endonuclease
MSYGGLDRFLGDGKENQKNSEEQEFSALIKRHKYGGRGREWHHNFVRYMYAIANHPNYKGMPWGIDENGKVRWDAPSHRPPGGKWSNLHDERLIWWKQKAIEIGEPTEGKWISKVAKEIHPFKKKPCQTCGREMSLLYEYPTKRTIEKINKIPNLLTPFDYNDFQSITEIIPEIIEQSGREILPEICIILDIPATVAKDPNSLISYVSEQLIQQEAKGILSPGAMSNAPDRLDGFHTYNLCCRSKQDTGRTKENLMLYGIDRRTFEYWCDGDWAAADFLMKQKVEGDCMNHCGRIEELTADHIGPLSLGFCHRPRFRALCRSCNSAKNNRMSLQDVLLLKEDEAKGENVVSWYAQRIWEKLKDNVKSDEDALRLSKLMRANQNQYLMLLSKLLHLGFGQFLEGFLNPGYALNRYSIEGFTGRDFSYQKLVVSHRQETYASSMISRTRRIAFEALEEYAKKGNRNAILFQDKELASIEIQIISTLKEGATSYERANRLLKDYMNKVTDKLIQKGVPRGYWK